MALKTLGLQKAMLDFSRKDIHTYVSSNVDIKTRGLEVHVLNGGIAYNCTGATLKLYVRTKNQDVYESVSTTTGSAAGVYEVFFPEGMSGGLALGEIILTNGAEAIGSFQFPILIIDSITSNGSISQAPGAGVFFNVINSENARAAAEAARVTEFNDMLANGYIIPQNPVVTFANLSSKYPSPIKGWTAKTLNDGKIYRYDGTEWAWIDTITASSYDALLTTFSAQLAEIESQKANRDEVTNVMTPKGNSAYASLPTTGNTVGWYYYCPDGDSEHGAGNYAWNGTSWYFSGTGDEGYNKIALKADGIEISTALNNMAPYINANTMPVGHNYRVNDFSLISNLPVTSGYGLISVFSHDNTKSLYWIQTLYDISANKYYIRYKLTDYGNWIELAPMEAITQANNAINNISPFGLELHSTDCVPPYDNANTFPVGKVYRITDTSKVSNLPLMNSAYYCSLYTFNFSSLTTDFATQICAYPTLNRFFMRTAFATYGDWIELADKNYAPCCFSLFSNFGIIGDSYTCGGAWNNSETEVINGYEQSWGKILGRATGTDAHIFGISGSTTASWLSDTSQYGLSGMLADNALQLYILCHAINDANTGLSIGNITDLNGITDPTTLPNTFINNMAKIRYYCKQHSPNARIVYMLSDGYTYNNIDKSAYDAATKQVAEYYREPYINQHEHPFYASSAYKNLTKGHPRAQGYSVMAKAIKQLIEECMSKSEYLDYFNDIYVVN